MAKFLRLLSLAEIYAVLGISGIHIGTWQYWAILLLLFIYTIAYSVED